MAGLCGTYDGNQDNDLLDPNGVATKVPEPGKRPDSYSVKWRVDQSNSIFRGYRQTVSMESPVYCSCYTDGTKSCDFFGDVSTCGVTNKGKWRGDLHYYIGYHFSMNSEKLHLYVKYF